MVVSKCLLNTLICAKHYTKSMGNFSLKKIVIPFVLSGSEGEEGWGGS